LTENLSVDTDDFFVDATTGRVGIGTDHPLNWLDIQTGGGSLAAVHIGETAYNGGYIFSVDDHQLILSGGAEYTISGWTARDDLASIVSMNNGNVYFSADSGLSEGNTFSPTLRMWIDNSGNVGIGGTASPNSTLEVIGNLNVTENITTPKLCIGSDCQTSWPAALESGWTNTSTVTSTDLNVELTQGNLTVGDTLFVDNSTGRVGIGTNNPSNDLHVDGNITVNGNINTPDSFFIGNGSSVSGTYSTAIGKNANVTGSGYSVAIGSYAKADYYAVAIGDNANAVSGADSGTAIGRNSAATGDSSIALGYGASASVLRSTAIGRAANASGQYAVAIGYESVADQTNSIALGRNASTTAANQLMIGSDSNGLDVIIKNGDVGIGTTSPARSLHINDTLRLEPRSAAPSSPAEGDIYFDSDLHMPCYYNSSDWLTFDGSTICS
jgi:hypothetical protein